MSENNPAIKTIEAIPYEAIINLEVSGGFYSRIHQLLKWYAQQTELNKFIEALKSLKGDKPSDDPYVYHLETIWTLLVSVEKAAREQSKMKDIEIKPTT